MRDLVTFIVVCKGRLKHLKKTLGLIEKDFRCILVDYSCPDGCGVWCNENMHNTGLIKLDTPEYFNKARANNLGAGFVQTKYVGFLDCDVLVFPGFAEEVNRFVSDITYLSSFGTGPGLSGFIVCSLDAFNKVGGYDEEATGYGYEDIQFKLKLELINLKPANISSCMLQHIEHDDTLRTKFYKEKDIKISRLTNKQILSKNLEKFQQELFMQELKENKYPMASDNKMGNQSTLNDS